MAPIRYSLHYEDYSDHLMSRFGKLLQMQSLVDMTLMCSSHTLRVHKAVLAASSAYFHEVLQKQNCEPLVILKMRFSVLKCLIEFMYCGKTQCLEENLDELVSAAQFLKIKGLSKVTKEGLGITNTTELPVFTPPVVINRPPKSLFEESIEPRKQSPFAAAAPLASALPLSEHPSIRPPKDPVMRIPYDIDSGSMDPTLGADYANAPRFKPRRGRPSSRRIGGWEPPGVLGRAAERALQRREQDSRKAIHQLKNLQSRQMQDYMDRVTLSQAVNSICSEPSNNYMNMDSDLLYSSNLLDSNMTFSKNNLGNETITSYSTTGTINKSADSQGVGAMSEYVNALKNAGLPTDLPILLESGDGSYINVNEQVLMDMVQSNEIQYEVIDQPNIIEKVTDPTEIKSIDELSKSIERSEMLINKSMPSSIFDKETEFMDHEEAIHSLNEILPDTLEPFTEQENFVVMAEGTNTNNDNNDFSSIVNDMQFFSKSMSDDVKKYYEQPSKGSTDLCPTSSNLDTSFNISFLDSKTSHFGSDHLGQDFNPLDAVDLRRNDDTYDFSLMTPSDGLDCLMTPKRLDENVDKEKSFKDNDILELGNLQSTNELPNLSDIGDSNYSIPQNEMFNEKDASVSKKGVEDKQSSLVDFESELDSLKNCKSSDDNYLCDLTSNKEWTTDRNSTDMIDNFEFNGSLENNDENYLSRKDFSTNNIDLGKKTSIDIDGMQDENFGEVDNIFDESLPLAVGLLPIQDSEKKSDEDLLDEKFLKRKRRKKN